MKKLLIILLIPFVLFSCKEGFTQPDVLTTVSDARFKVAPFCYPNPVKKGEKFYLYFELSDSCFANIYISNITGDVINSIFYNQKIRKGRHDIEMPTVNNMNVPIGSGIYFLNLELDSELRKSVLFEIR